MSIWTSGSRACVALELLATLLLSAAAVAQTVTGTLSGTIVDAQGSVIPGATITIVNEATNDARTALSGTQGDFLVTNLQPGQYTLRVALQSFRTLERKNIVLSAGERLAVANLT